MELTSENVETIFKNCLFKEDEAKENYIEAKSVKIHVGFHPKRIVMAKEDIKSMLENLPDQFQKGSGGGWSFLNMCVDKNGNQWTGFHESADQLIALGLANNLIEFMMPREMWEGLPGGLPYVIVK